MVFWKTFLKYSSKKWPKNSGLRGHVWLLQAWVDPYPYMPENICMALCKYIWQICTQEQYECKCKTFGCVNVNYYTYTKFTQYIYGY
jgi:hypothetical protein